jgi:hypothetical protein
MTVYLLGAALCVPLLSQETEGLRARQLYYKSKSEMQADQTTAPPPASKKTTADIPARTGSTHRRETKSTEAPRQTLGLKYSIEQGDASDAYRPVDPDKTFATGDVIRLRLEVNAPAYVYLMSKGASGQGNFLFPEAGEDNRLKPYRSVQVPAAGDPVRFDEPAGTETLYILVSRTPVTDLQRAIPASGSAPTVPSAQFSEVAQRADGVQSRDLVRGKAPLTSGEPDNAAALAFYAVTASSAPGAQLLEKIELKHR